MKTFLNHYTICFFMCATLGFGVDSLGASAKCSRLRAAMQDGPLLVTAAMTSFAAVEKSPQKLASIETKVKALLASPEFGDMYCQRLSVYFADDEMGKVADFMATPVGIKWRNSLGAIQQNGLLSVGFFLNSKAADFKKQGLPAFPN